MYSKVILPLDGSELAQRALPYAKSFSSAFSVPLELVRAADGGAQDALQHLARVRDELRAEGFAATTTALSGQAGPAVVDWACADPRALLVMSTHGRGGLARMALGSVTDRVLHTTPNPILIVRPGTETPAVRIHTIVVPLDGSELAELSLPHATALASAWDASVELVYVTTSAEAHRDRISGAVRGRTAFGDPQEQIARDFAQADDENAEAYLERMRLRLALDHPEARTVHTRRIRHDDPAQAIIDRTANGATLVVMTTHGRTGIGRLVLGSVTDQVVRHGSAPVLVVRQHHEHGAIGLEQRAEEQLPNLGHAGAQPA